MVGVNVARERVKLFTLMGTLAGFAAVLLTLENRNFFNTQGQGYLLIALASVFIGGTSIFGGQATIVGTFFGAFIISMIEAGSHGDRHSGILGACGRRDWCSSPR